MTHDFLLPLIKTALAEDIGSGDITSQLLIPERMEASMAFVARQKMVVCGVEVPKLVYAELGNISVELLVEEGVAVSPGTMIAKVSGNARAILTGERVALNIMQRMCGIATITRSYVQAVAGTKAKILDTRKTMPGMRMLDKYAVRIGGGMNHRMGLYDAVLVKDNHIVGVKGGLGELILATREKMKKLGSTLPIYVECDTLAQLVQALAAKPERIMLDNMKPEMLKEAVKLTAGAVPLEATGGVTLANVHEVAETGVDFISIGALTHSVPAVDIGLDSL